MSDEESIPPKPAARTGRDALEVRVIGGGMGDPRRSGVGQEGWDEGELAEEEVTRLDQEPSPLANRRLEDEERADPVPLARGKRRLSMPVLTVLMAGGAVLLAVGVVALALMFKEDPHGREPAIEGLVVVSSQVEEDAAAEESIASAESLIEESLALYGKFHKAENVDEVVGLIRDGERLKPLLEEEWKPMGEKGKLVASVMNLGGRRFVTIRGTDSRLGAFEFFVLRSEGRLKIDWEVSRAIGDVAFDELKDIKIGRTVKMRVILESSNFHPVEYPDDEFRCYEIRVPGFDFSVFGYARMGSEVVRLLSDALNEGTVLFDQGGEVSMIVVLKNAGRGEIGQFEIAEVVQKGWIEH